MKCAYSTNVGVKRQKNQDAYLAAKINNKGEHYYMFAVADGLGGHLSGEIASNMAIEYIKKNIAAINDYNDYNEINAMINDINQCLLKIGKEKETCKGMATTLTLCIVNQKKIIVVHVGDSRAYRINALGLEQLTKDHSLVQVLLDEGKLTSAEALNHPQKNIITRAIGSDEVVQASLYNYDIQHDDIFLICSDGLYNMVDDAEIYHIIQENPLEEATKILINRANENGGNDNITVVLFKPEEEENYTI